MLSKPVEASLLTSVPSVSVTMSHPISSSQTPSPAKVCIGNLFIWIRALKITKKELRSSAVLMILTRLPSKQVEGSLATLPISSWKESIATPVLPPLTST